MKPRGPIKVFFGVSVALLLAWAHIYGSENVLYLIREQRPSSVLEYRKPWQQKVQQVPIYSGNENGRVMTKELAAAGEKHKDADKSCKQPVSKFVYVKTHKTGSTSLQILLSKFLMKNGFLHMTTNTCPFPFVGGYPGRFKCKFKFPPNATINISHTRFDAEEMKRCFHPETKYFTTLREPWEQFQSSFNFFQAKSFGKAHCPPMPKTYVRQERQITDVHQFMLDAASLLNKSVPWYFRFKNYQSHDLGIDPTLTDEDLIREKILELDRNMDLVMLLEYLDESLILLKDLLCIDWDVIRSIKRWNGRKYEKEDRFLTESHRNTFRELNKIDIALYDHFNKTFWARVNKYGRKKMAENLEKLRDKRTVEKPDRKEKYTEEDDGDCETWMPEIKRYMALNSGDCFIPIFY